MKAKSFTINKRQVFRAYELVKANKGAPGVDEQSLAEYEVNLKGNLYKLWNRMSSGSYISETGKSCDYSEEIRRRARIRHSDC